MYVELDHELKMINNSFFYFFRATTEHSVYYNYDGLTQPEVRKIQ